MRRSRAFSTFARLAVSPVSREFSFRRSNVRHLMLRHHVVAAVEAEKFHIYPVSTIDEGIEILTGLPAGSRDANGNFPFGSINQRVEVRLVQLAEKRVSLGRSSSDVKE
jgi:predicted ATP-dependent protease